MAHFSSRYEIRNKTYFGSGCKGIILFVLIKTHIYLLRAATIYNNFAAE